MTDEAVEVEDTGADLGPEPTEIEIEAASHGWNPEGVDGKLNLTAEEFMDRQPLYDEIRSTKKQLKRIQEGMDALKVHHSKVAANERAKVMNELKARKKDALQMDDFDAVMAIDDRIAEVKAEDYAESIAPQTNNTFNDWISDNKWYEQDAEMKTYADLVGQGFAAQHPDKPLTDVYDFVSKEVKSRFKNKFENTSRQAPSPVEGTQRSGRAGSRKLRAKDLPAQDYQIMQSILRAGGISEEQYLKEYSELNS